MVEDQFIRLITCKELIVLLYVEQIRLMSSFQGS